MKRENINRSYWDWAYLRDGILFFVIAALFSGSLIAGSGYFEKRLAQQYRLNHARFYDIRSRYLAVDEEEKLIKEYLPRFTDLHGRGLLGEERRLNWIEALDNAGEEIKLPALSYEITAQEHYTPSFPLILGGYKLFVSPMNLDMQLLHEGELFGLFNRLDESARGRYSVSACELTRNFVETVGKTVSKTVGKTVSKTAGKTVGETVGETAGKAISEAAAGNVAASCELQWFSVKFANGEEIKP